MSSKQAGQVVRVAGESTPRRRCRRRRIGVDRESGCVTCVGLGRVCALFFFRLLFLPGLLSSSSPYTYTGQPEISGWSAAHPVHPVAPPLIVGLDHEEPVQVQDLRKFVDHLLILRDRTDLNIVEIKLGNFLEEDQPYVNLWTRFAVICKVRSLTLHIRDNQYLCLDDQPLVSRHLRTLDLHGVALQQTFLDFASCPELEDMKMDTCLISVNKISSRSLKHLSITGCRSDLDYRIHVSTPGLVSLELDAFDGLTPFLENMALLETAFVYLHNDGDDVCLNYDYGVLCGANNAACKNCVPIGTNCSSDSVLLGGISSAKHLKLMSEPGKFIFSRDLKHCPTFTKLKTLLLNKYWCDAPDMDPLSCILKNSPVLEKLTLELFPKGHTPKVRMKGSYCCMERPSAISEHLKVVEVKCDVVNRRIAEVLKFLCAFSPFDIRFSFE